MPLFNSTALNSHNYEVATLPSIKEIEVHYTKKTAHEESRGRGPLSYIERLTFHASKCKFFAPRGNLEV